MAGSGGLKTPDQMTAGSGYMKKNQNQRTIGFKYVGETKIRIKESLVDYFKEMLGFMRELSKSQLYIGWLFEVTVNQHPPAHHPLDARYY
jgi:hypothetical protein